MPTGFACAGQEPPVGAVATALHALALLIARQMTVELQYLESTVEYCVVPPLCPLVSSPYDFTRTDDHIARAIKSTEDWIADGGLEKEAFRARCNPISIDRWAVAIRGYCFAARRWINAGYQFYASDMTGSRRAGLACQVRRVPSVDINEPPV
jgi:hypothetical protein